MRLGVVSPLAWVPMSVAERIETVRRVAARHGVPLDVVDALGLTTAQVARSLSCGHRTVEAWVADGKLPAFRKGRLVRILVPDLVEFLEENRTVAAPKPGNSLRSSALRLIEE